MNKKAFAKLLLIQSELKVPKGQRNAFGKYNYRSAEDILEAVKPLCTKHNVTILVTEQLQSIEGHVYVESIAVLVDNESGENVQATGTAVIDFNAKGMQKPQQTGAASSYAKKYGLGNLLLIDDTVDADGERAEPTAIPNGTKPKVVAKKPVAKKPVAKAKPVVKSKDMEAAAVENTDTSEAEDIPESGTKVMTDKQRANFLDGIKKGKFDLVETHLKNYQIDNNSSLVRKRLKAAKAGK